MYYYIYYLLSKFAKRFNNRDGDFAFTAILYFIILFGLNVNAILVIICDKVYFKSHLGLMIFIAVAVPCLIHYFGLLRNKKYMEVIKMYDEIFENNKNWAKIIVFFIYLITTFVLSIYVANYIKSSL